MSVSGSFLGAMAQKEMRELARTVLHLKGDVESLKRQQSARPAAGGITVVRQGAAIGYTDLNAVEAVEAESTLDLTGDVTIAEGKSLTTDQIYGQIDPDIVIVGGVTLHTGDVIAGSGYFIVDVNTDIINEDAFNPGAGVTIDGVLLQDGGMSMDYLNPPSGDKTITMAAKSLTYNFTTGSLLLHMLGAFGDAELFHVHQHTGNPQDGAKLAKFEAVDSDCDGIEIEVHPAAKALGITQGLFSLPAGADIGEFSIDGTMGGNSDAAVPTEKATKKYVDDQIAGSGGHGTGSVTQHNDVSNAGSGIIISDAERAALHAEAHTHTHASTTGRTVNDHHAESHALSSHSDVALTGAFNEDLHMYTSANAALVPLVLEYPTYVTSAANVFRIGGQGQYINLGSTNFGLMFIIPLPTNKGGLSLHVDDIVFQLYDADGNDKVTGLFLYGFLPTGAIGTLLSSSTAGWSSAPAEHTWSRSATDVTGYRAIKLFVTIEATTNLQFELNSLQALCYYDT